MQFYLILLSKVKLLMTYVNFIRIHRITQQS